MSIAIPITNALSYLFDITQGAFGELVTDEKWVCKAPDNTDTETWYTMEYTGGESWSAARIHNNDYYFGLIDEASREFTWS